MSGFSLIWGAPFEPVIDPVFNSEYDEVIDSASTALPRDSTRQMRAATSPGWRHERAAHAVEHHQGVR